MKTFKELNDLVIQWGKDRDLYHPEHGATADSQRLKFFEELGELAQGFIKKDKLLIKDALGDLQVVSLHISYLENEELSQLLADGVFDTIISMFKKDIPSINELEAITVLTAYIQEKYSGLERFFVIECISSHFGFSQLECLNHAYNEIKDRKGKMFNRTFVKDN